VTPFYSRPYVESSVFIAWIKGEKLGKKQEHDCKLIFDAIIDAAKAGQFKIYTSALTLAEVYKNKKDPSHYLTDQENEDLRPYFREDFIQLIETDRDVGEKANLLCRTHKAKPDQPALRPNDAIHIASAEKAGCDAILAYDPDFTKQTHETIDIKWPDLSRIPGKQLPAMIQTTLFIGQGEEPIEDDELIKFSIDWNEVVASSALKR
jgi:predicted nucleic acid-binding protein